MLSRPRVRKTSDPSLPPITIASLHLDVFKFHRWNIMNPKLWKARSPATFLRMAENRAETTENQPHWPKNVIFLKENAHFVLWAPKRPTKSSVILRFPKFARLYESPVFRGFRRGISLECPPSPSPPGEPRTSAIKGSEVADCVPVL